MAKERGKERAAAAGGGGGATLSEHSLCFSKVRTGAARTFTAMQRWVSVHTAGVNEQERVVEKKREGEGEGEREREREGDET